MERQGYRYKDKAVEAIETLEHETDEMVMDNYVLKIVDFFNYVKHSNDITERDNKRWIADIKRKLIDLYVSNPNDVTKELCSRYAMDNVITKNENIEEGIYDILMSKMGYVEKIEALASYNVPFANAESIIKTTDAIIIECYKQRRCTSSNEQKEKFDIKKEELIKGSIKNLMELVRMQAKCK